VAGDISRVRGYTCVFPLFLGFLWSKSFPAMLYRLTKRIGQILRLPLTLHYSLAPPLQQEMNDDPEHYTSDNAPPEVAFIAAAVLVLKMVYGLDGQPRYAAKG
jgi:hypothetical protein